MPYLRCLYRIGADTELSYALMRQAAQDQSRDDYKRDRRGDENGTHVPASVLPTS